MKKNILDTRKGRFVAFGLMYISEGIPYGFTSTAMVAFMRKEGLSLEQIGTFVAAMFLPWALKWVWAPIIDVVKLHRFGGRKGWIIFCSTMMTLTLVVTALVDFVDDFQFLMAMIVLNNVFCATQDVAIDSLAVGSLRADERARGNGFMFGGQMLGIALGGGGAIFVFGQFGFNAALVYISALLLLCMAFVVLFIRDPDVHPANEIQEDGKLLEVLQTLGAFFKELYASFLRSGSGPKVGLLYSILPTGAIALAYAMLGTMKVDYGLTNNQIAELSIYSTVASALGCLLGGFLGDRFGLKRTMAFCCVITTLPTVYMASQISALGLTGVAPEVFYSVIVIHGFLLGMCFGVHFGIFMGLTNPVVAATQFTAFMAMCNLAISIGNYWQGVVAQRYDYATVLYLDALVVIVPLMVIPFLRTREEQQMRAGNEPVTI